MESKSLYNGEVALSLDGRHCYWASVNGREKQKAIGVTSVSGLLDKSGPMKYWAVSLTCDYIKALLDAEKFVTYDELEIAKKQHTIRLTEAAESGTNVHGWIEAFISAQLNGLSAPEVPQNDEAILNGALAFMRWVSEHTVRFISSERLVYSVQHGFAGTLDAEAIVDGKKCVLDWKTNKPRKPKEGKENVPCPHGCPKLGCQGVYNEHRLQTAAYQLAAEEEGSQYDGDRIIVGLDKLTGDFSFHVLDNYEEDAKAFVGLLTTKKWLNEIK